MVTEKYDRNTEPCNTEKYGRIRSVYSMYTVVYGAVYGRKRSYTEFVNVDLGGDEKKEGSEENFKREDENYQYQH